MAFMSCFAIFLLCSYPSSAEIVTYPFEEVEVLYAAEFQVTPVAVEENKWFSDIAGGKDKPLQILYGIVRLKKKGSHIQEVYIKISGENGLERFLHNSMSFNESYDKTLFWSGKKLEGANVVKDYSKPLKAVTLKKSFDENQQITSMYPILPTKAGKALLMERYGMNKIQRAMSIKRI